MSTVALGSTGCDMGVESVFSLTVPNTRENLGKETSTVKVK